MIETGVTFGNVHSFRGLDLILSGVEISPAAPKTTYIELPGGDGAIDLSEAFGEVKFSDRNISLVFAMNPASGLSEAAWEEKKTEVSNVLNGLACKIILDKDPDYYWDGRCTVDTYKSQKHLRQFVVSARVRPYKNKLYETVMPVSLGVIGGASVTKNIKLMNSRKSVCPLITCTGETSIVFNGNRYTLSAGTHKVLNIRLLHGENRLTLSGYGTVRFTYQEADL